MSNDSPAPERIDLEIAEESRLNPLWIEGFAGGEAALEISVPGFRLHTALEALFGRVEEVPVASWDVSEATTRIPFPDRTFDLVTLYGRRPSVHALGEVVRVLRPSGVLYLAVRNRWWYGRLRGAGYGRDSGGFFAGSRLARPVLSAGFSVVRQYFVDPSLARPMDVIPGHGPSLRAHEALRRHEGEAGMLRFALAALRMSGVLYPGRLIIARV